MTARPTAVATAESSLFRFDQSVPFVPWEVVDDRVMGGVSQSEFVSRGSDGARFTGRVSLDRNGGFCSVRSPDLSGQIAGGKAISLYVRGDGRTYSLGLHTPALLPGTSYRCRFTPTPARWERVVLPLDRFVMTRLGMRVGVSPVNPDRVCAISVMISDRQEGRFALDVLEVTLVSG